MLAIAGTNLGCHAKQLNNFDYGKGGTGREQINRSIGKFKGVILASVITKSYHGNYTAQLGSYKNLLACGFKRAGKAFRNRSTGNTVVLLYKITAK